MYFLKYFSYLMIALSLAACSEKKDKQGNPNLVLLTPDYGHPFKGVPLEAVELLVNLTPEGTRRVIGGSPLEKIQTHSVTAYVEYDDGWLLASGRGEWGGVVFWLSKKGDYKIIRDDNLAYPIDAILYENKVLLIQGMAHLSISNGHLLEINRNKQTFVSRTYSLRGYPSGFEKKDGQWIVPIPSRNSYHLLSELQAGNYELRTR